MERYVTAGVALLAGAALFEVALIPGIVIGGAAVLAPQLLPKVLPGFGRRSRAGRRERDAGRRTRLEPEILPPERTEPAPPTASTGFNIKQAVAKTITFRIIVTTLDFTTNYVVIGEFATAAGLSAFALVAGPVFYLVHEAAWSYMGPAGDAVTVALPRRDAESEDRGEGGGVTISRALAKTITFRSIATVMDFSANYFVTRDVVIAAGLSAFAFVVGPFVYFGHEKAWDYFTEGREPPIDVSSPTRLLPAPV